METIETENIDWRARALAAEKTVDVLKKKVRGLFSGQDSNQIHAQIAAARRRQERLVMAREMAEGRAEELAELVAVRTRDIQRILDNVTFGFLVVDADGNICDGYTRSCDALFGVAVQTGGALADLLRLEEKDARFLLLGLEQVFEDFFPEDISVGQLESRYVVGDRVLRIDGRVVRGQAGIVDGVLFTVSDISALDASEKANRDREGLLLIASQRPAFKEFIRDSRDSLANARTAVSDVVHKRIVHTVKGNAACWGLADVAQIADDIETNGVFDLSAIDTLETSIRHFLQSNYGLLNVSFDSVECSFSVTGSQLKSFMLLLEQPNGLVEARRKLARLVRRPARELLGPVDKYVKRLADQLGKNVHFEVEGADLMVDIPRLRPVFLKVNHLLRNAIDHGIEAPEDRDLKAAVAKLCLSLGEDADHWTIAVSDDGAGIDVARLKELAVASELVTVAKVAEMEAEGRSHELVFMDGLSSSRNMSSVSGRGMGMSAVASSVAAQGGYLTVNTGRSGTQVRIFVPKAGPAVGPHSAISMPTSAQA